MSEALNDGGPAYPQNFEIMASGEVVSTGNLTPSGFQGLSLRDYFAAQALVFLSKTYGSQSSGVVASAAYGLADAMILARGTHGDD